MEAREVVMVTDEMATNARVIAREKFMQPLDSAKGDVAFTTSPSSQRNEAATNVPVAVRVRVFGFRNRGGI